MTLHQAAQKAVEALPRFRWDQDMDVLAGPYPDGEWVRRADVIAALQQQPAPVGHVVVDMQSNGPGDRIKWTKLALEHGTPLYASPPAIQPPAQSAIDKVRDLRDVQGQQGIGTDNYMRGLYNGLELALCTLEEREPDYAEKAALQHQEVPCGNTPYDEGPFTIATDGGQEVPREPSEEMMTAGLRAACLYDTPESRRDLARAWKVMSALYASPSTTRQQEVGDEAAFCPCSFCDSADACRERGCADAAYGREVAGRRAAAGGHTGDTERVRCVSCEWRGLVTDCAGFEQCDCPMCLAPVTDCPEAAPSTPESADGGPHG